MTTAELPALRAALADLVLVRLALPSQKLPSATNIRKDLASASGTPITPDDYAKVTSVLQAEGLVAPRPRSKGAVQLTDAGRDAALRFLGVEALPPRTTWKVIRSRYLPAKAVGAGSETIDSSDRLGAFLIRREYDLPEGGTVRRALEALVCKLTGHPDETTLEGLFRAVLSESLGTGERFTTDDLVKQFPRKVSGARSGRLDDLRAAVVAKWLQGEEAQTEERTREPKQPELATEPEQLDLSEFAATVKRIARDCPAEGRFGNKAFIAAVWRESQAEVGFRRMPLAEFKASLAEASREGLIRLDPADLVQSMDPQLVADSETVRAGAAFHFILIEESAP